MANVEYKPRCSVCPHHNGLGCWVSQDCNMKTAEIIRERRIYHCLKPGDYKEFLENEEK